MKLERWLEIRWKLSKKSNHEMGEQVKHDIQALEDEVEHYFKK